jgi:drug/metabolite transporter (DMT)-like permease
VNRPVSPTLAVVIGVLFVSFSAILIRLSQAPPLVIGAYRMAFSALLLLPSAIAHRRRYRAAISRTSLLLSLLSGLFLALHFASWITSLFHTTVAASTVLVTTQPLFVVVFGFLILRERISRRSALLMLIAFTCSAVLAASEGSSAGDQALLGNVLALAGAVTVAGYMLVGRVVRRTLPVGLYTVLVYTVAALLLVGFALLAGHSLTGYAPREYLIFVALAIFPTLLGHNLFSWSLKWLQTSLVSTAILGEPVFATLLAMLFFAEIPGAVTVIAGTGVLVSLFLFLRADRPGSLGAGGSGDSTERR